METIFPVLGVLAVLAGLVTIVYPLIRERDRRMPLCPACGHALAERERSICPSCEEVVQPIASRAWGGRQPIRTSIAGVFVLVGGGLLLAPRVLADGPWTLAPDLVLIRAMDDIDDPTDPRVNLFIRRLGAGSIEEPAKAELIRRCAQRLRTDDDPEAWRFVTILLAGMKPNDQRLTDVLLDGLRHKNPGVREQAAYALGAFGVHEDRCVPALAQAALDDTPSVRAIIAWALWRFACDRDLAPEGVSALSTLVLDGALPVRFQAAEGLTLVLDHPADVLPQLMEGLDSPDFMTRLKAVSAIGRIGPEARPALAALERARTDPQASVAKAATNAIARITTVAATPDD